MSMTLGDDVRITLFGESHGPAVGALLQGIAPGTPVDVSKIQAALDRRRPGRKGLTARAESDIVEILSGVYEGCATGHPILFLVRNADVRSRDYGFLPDHPRPGHADLPEAVRTGNAADPRGGGTHSGRLTLGLVAGGEVARQILSNAGIEVHAHCGGVGEINAPLPSGQLAAVHDLPSDDPRRLFNCLDSDSAAKMRDAAQGVRKETDSIGSRVDAIIGGLPLGMGAPWYAGIEPALAHALMAIPGARAVEFGRGTAASKMRGSAHNDAWVAGVDGPTPAEGETPADGALGGMATGAPLHVRVHFKPPSSIPAAQSTLHLPSGEMRELSIGGRHDPVLAPRAAPVVDAVCCLVLADLLEGRTA